MKKRIISLCFMLAFVTTAFAGCKNEVLVPPNTVNNPSSQITEAPKPSVTNPFTGEKVTDESSLRNRPLAVMVSNIKIALPQKGISQADIIYELPVEGPITRLMAVFSDYTAVPEIGSVRSARHDFVELLTPFNPIYLHFGGSQAGKDAIAKNKIDDIDGLTMSTVAFHQDKARAASKGSEHSWFSNAALLKNGINKKGFDTTNTAAVMPIFSFAKPDVDVMTENTAAIATAKATIKMSTSDIATFTYNEQTKLYEKGQFGEAHLDANTNKAAAITNVLIMYTEVGLLPNGKNKEVNLSKGTGYYLSNGKRTEVRFEKKTVQENLKVFDLDGKEVQINVGKTWVSIAPKEFKANAVFA